MTDGAAAADVANDCNGVMSRSEHYSTAIPIMMGSTATAPSRRPLADRSSSR